MTQFRWVVGNYLKLSSNGASIDFSWRRDRLADNKKPMVERCTGRYLRRVAMVCEYGLSHRLIDHTQHTTHNIHSLTLCFLVSKRKPSFLVVGLFFPSFFLFFLFVFFVGTVPSWSVWVNSNSQSFTVERSFSGLLRYATLFRSYAREVLREKKKLFRIQDTSYIDKWRHRETESAFWYWSSDSSYQNCFYWYTSPSLHPIIHLATTNPNIWCGIIIRIFVLNQRFLFFQRMVWTCQNIPYLFLSNRTIRFWFFKWIKRRFFFLALNFGFIWKIK